MLTPRMNQTQRHPRPGKRRWSSLCSLPTQRPPEGSRARGLSDGGGGMRPAPTRQGSVTVPVRHVHARPSHSSHTCTHRHLTYVQTLTQNMYSYTPKHSILLLVHAHSGPTSDPEERQREGDPNMDAEASRNRGQRHKEVTFGLSVREENHSGGQ